MRPILWPSYAGVGVMRVLFVIILGLVTLYGPAQSQTCDGDAVGLGQIWPDTARDLWYSTGSGSRLIPEAWYRALPRADDGAPFAARTNLARYGFRFCDAKARDPLGFVPDRDASRAVAIGLTCAACHTGRLTDGTRDFIVQGGGAAMDLQRFTADLFAAVLKVRSGPYDTAAQTEDWLAFAQKVLGTSATPEAMQALHGAVSDWLQARKDVQGSIHRGGDWGFGRQDAMAVALNTVAALSDHTFPGGLPAASGPVSVPSLWLTPDMARLQWTGGVDATAGHAGSARGGAILRDVAEVIGTFAEVALPPTDAMANPGYVDVASSVRLGNLIRLQQALADLTPPLWPKEWGVIDRASADYKAGEALYTAHCAACHARVDRSRRQDIQDASGLAMTARPLGDAPFVRVVAAFALPGDTAPAVGTDLMAACNAFTHTSWGGRLAALTDTSAALTAFTATATNAKAARFAPGSNTQRLLADLALRVLWNKRAEVPVAVLPPQITAFFTWFTGAAPVDADDATTAVADDTPPSTHRQVDLDKARKVCADRLTLQRQTNPAAPAPGYKAGPLAGIFATAPYLHNGSVPTLDALLSAPDARPDRFAVGAVLFDPVKVGLGAAIKGGAFAEFKVTDLRGRIILGNSNEGHAYPAAPLTEVQRAQLILYLKGL